MIKKMKTKRTIKILFNPTVLGSLMFLLFFVPTIILAAYPYVYAGKTLYLESGQSRIIYPTASDPDGSKLDYSWYCNGGRLSNYNALNPVFYAPDISFSATYTCTITVTNQSGNSSNSSVNIVVNGQDYGTMSVSLAANPYTGNVFLSNVSLTANVSGGTGSNIIVYKFDCENDGIWNTTYETYNTSYTAYNICNYPNTGNYIARVKVERGGNSAESTTNIYVSGGSSNNYVTVDAGSDKDIYQSQPVTLGGSVYSRSGYALSYHWSCSGGTLSNSNSLSPIYYPPYVTVDTNYACTLTATDTFGNNNSDAVNIIVRRSSSSSGNYYTNLSVTTNAAEAISTDYATLKGTLAYDGGQNTSVRFSWGRGSAYYNYTNWVYNKRSGETFYASISGLEKGKVYHYRAEASNGIQTATGQDMTFITKPGSPTEFSATTLSSFEIQLIWNKGEGSCYTKVVRKKNSYPTNALDGVAVYYDSDNSYVDKNLSAGTTYYYRAWAVACDEGKYSFSDSLASKDYAVTGGQAVIPSEGGSVSEGNSIIVETLARNLSQNEKDWNDHVSAASGEEIEFNITVSADGNRPLTNVVAKNTLPKRMGCFYDVKIDGVEYDGSLGSISLGTVPLNQSKVISFKGLIDSEVGDDCRDQNINILYGSDELNLSSKVSANNVDEVSGTLRIGVDSGTDLATGVGQLLDSRISVSSLILLMLFLIFSMMVYQVFERKLEREKIQKRGSGPFRSPTPNVK